MINDCAHTWYARPEARTRIMVSPADETPMDPQDIEPDELDIAIGIDRMQQGLDIEVRRVERSWAGLRTFTPDRSLAFGWDATAEGILLVCRPGRLRDQTSPAAGRLVADLVLGRDPGDAGTIVKAIDPKRSRSPDPPILPPVCFRYAALPQAHHRTRMSIHAALTHRTAYRYDRPVVLGPQNNSAASGTACAHRDRVLLAGRGAKPHFLNWQQDPQGNFLARVVFPERVTHFDVTVDLVADMATINPFDFFLEPEAETWPLATTDI